jgi:hypothetical protein
MRAFLAAAMAAAPTKAAEATYRFLSGVDFVAGDSGEHAGMV